MKTFAIVTILVAVPFFAYAQSASERHVWQDATDFQPSSRTASAITGPITLSGNDEFASAGSTMEMTFTNGTTVTLTSVGASWRKWSVVNEEKYTAEVFRLSENPGELLHGNTLCGGNEPNKPMFVVFHESRLFNLPPSLGMAVFQSETPPHDINSPGLCGTYGYYTSTSSDDGLDINANVTGKWRIKRSLNPIDDTNTITLSLTADSGVSKYGEPVTVVARCKSNQTEFYTVWGDYLGDDSSDVYSNWKYVTVRLGSQTAQREKWGVSTDKTATFAPDWAGNFLKELLTVDQLVLQTVPYGEDPITAVFDVSGLQNGLRDIAVECNWSF